MGQKKFANFGLNAADDDDDDGGDKDDDEEGDGDDDRNTNNFAVRANYIKLSCSAHSGQVCHSKATTTAAAATATTKTTAAATIIIIITKVAATRLSSNCSSGASCGLHDVYVIYVLRIRNVR